MDKDWVTKHSCTASYWVLLGTHSLGTQSPVTGSLGTQSPCPPFLSSVLFGIHKYPYHNGTYEDLLAPIRTRLYPPGDVCNFKDMLIII